MAGIRVTVRGANEIAGRFANTEARRGMLVQAMEGHLALIHAAVVPLTPVGVTGHLRGSWQSTPPQWAGTSLVGILGSALLYADVMEEGRTPGAAMPPPEAIASWVAVKMGPDVDPYVVARSIGRKGITGRHMLRKAVEATDPVARTLWAAVAARLVADS